jgi:UDP-glucose 4-epimerase
VLVTGGAGFIGSHVVDHLVAAGHSVAVLDNLSTGNLSNVNKQARFYEGDVTGPLEALQKERPEVVVHMAAQINVRVSIEDPILDAQVNILGIINVLRASVDLKVRRFVFASSGGAIYGDQPRLPYTEETPPVPTSPYGIAKLAGEHYVRYFGLEGVCLRLANVYGPRQDARGEAGVVAIFTSKMRNKESPIIYGDGKQTRDYVYVEDVARAFVAALDAAPGTYNIGTGVETDANTLAGKLKKLTGFSGEIRHAAAIPGEVRRSAVDASRAKTVLKWFPKVSLDEGLKRTVDA